MAKVKKDEAVVKAEAKKVHASKARFQDAVWFDKLTVSNVMVLGCGGIGSWVVFALARIGCPLVVYDMDSVEEHNMGGQLFHSDCVGKFKTDSIRNICLSFSGIQTKLAVEAEYTKDSPTNSIVVAAFDDMKSRKLAFNKWASAILALPDEEAAKCIFIDGRLLAEDYQVYAVTIDTIEQYRESLFDDSEVDEVSCTLKSTTHCSMGIASEIVSVLTNFMANIELGADLREVPFLVEKSIQSYSYKLINRKNEILCSTQ